MWKVEATDSRTVSKVCTKVWTQMQTKKSVFSKVKLDGLNEQRGAKIERPFSGESPPKERERRINSGHMNTK